MFERILIFRRKSSVIIKVRDYWLAGSILISRFFIKGSSNNPFAPGRDGGVIQVEGVCSSVPLPDGPLREARRQRHSLLVIQIYLIISTINSDIHMLSFLRV